MTVPLINGLYQICDPQEAILLKMDHNDRFEHVPHGDLLLMKSPRCLRYSSLLQGAK